MKILESIVYVFSELNFFGGREIGQEGELFQKFKISPKSQHYIRAILHSDGFLISMIL